MTAIDPTLLELIGPPIGIGLIVGILATFVHGKKLVLWYMKLRAKHPAPTVVAPTPPPRALARPALPPAPAIKGPVFFDGLWYGSIDQAAGYLGITPATIEAAVRPDSSAQADAFWKDTGPSVALSHRVLKLGKTRSRVFIREYTDHQTAYVRRKDGRFPIHGRFNRGPQGDEAILRLASAI